MTAEKWKKFFRSKGWIDGQSIRRPGGVMMYIKFRADAGELSEFSTDNITLASEDVLKVDLRPYGYPETDDKRYYLWDDIQYVRNYKVGSE